MLFYYFRLFDFLFSIYLLQHVHELLILLTNPQLLLNNNNNKDSEKKFQFNFNFVKMILPFFNVFLFFIKKQ